MEEIALEPFARTIDNARMETRKKEVIRDGDPMAEFFLKKQEQVITESLIVLYVYTYIYIYACISHMDPHDSLFIQMSLNYVYVNGIIFKMSY